ncbi:MAG TPA: ABC transporter permease subunit [Rugosimonospora sp.]|nr:ABC transporter permease subunit [Rugosimonospora sp.]
MTALALRPLPWRRMGWITWRQHRLALAGAGALLAAAAGWVLSTGLRMHHAYASVVACRPLGSDVCQRVANDFANTYAGMASATTGLLLVVPALIGAFTGAPVLAREFETGTFRYSFTQGIGRTRWTVAKLVPLAVAVTAGAAAFSVLFSWAYQPIIGKQYGFSPLQPLMFSARGVAFAGWTLATFAIGALAGALIRRVVPALFATLAVWAALAFGTGLYLRDHYEAPKVSTDPNIGNPHWLLSQEWLRNGKPASLPMLDGVLHQIDVRAVTPEVFQPGPGTPENIDPVQYLAQHGFTQLTTYQPAGRFWLFQSIEGGWLFALAVLLIATTLWLVRRRTS